MTNEQNQGSSELNRRDFLQRSSLATLMTMVGAVELIAEQPPLTDYSTKGKKVKCAVIGLGQWGREISTSLMQEDKFNAQGEKILPKLAEADLVAGCDTYPAAFKRFANIAPKAETVEDYHKILENKEIQAVIIATPSHKHREVAIAALQAGKHVYCEAPLATTVEDARAIALEAKKHPELVFQAGLQQRSDPQRHFLLPFIRSGALGKNVMARAQWHKRTIWSSAAANPEREKELNWRLKNKTSCGLVGEVGIHQLDAAGWFLKGLPVSVNGFGSLIELTDGRDVPDTVQAVLEFPGGVRLIYDATLVSSFEGEYEVYYGSEAAVILRGHRAWMIKEVGSTLTGWEPYARKDSFFPDEASGIALVANASKLSAQGEGAAQADPYPGSPLYYALEAFFCNCNVITPAVEDFKVAGDIADTSALAAYLDENVWRNRKAHKPAAGFKEGFEATVMAFKTNEAILKNDKVKFEKEWFTL